MPERVIFFKPRSGEGLKKRSVMMFPVTETEIRSTVGGRCERRCGGHGVESAAGPLLEAAPLSEQGDRRGELAVGYYRARPQASPAEREGLRFVNADVLASELWYNHRQAGAKQVFPGVVVMSNERATTKTEYAHIVCTPGIVGGEPRIACTRIRVRDIVSARDIQAATPEEIAATIYPQLSLAQVYAALAYYEDHRDEIDALHRREGDYLEGLRKSPPPYLDVQEGS